MKKLSLLTLLFLIFSCASIEEMNTNLSYLNGMKIDKAISIMGIGPPTSSVILENTKIYIWESTDKTNVPIGGYNYGYDNSGNYVQTWDPNQSSSSMTFKCKITIYTSSDFVIKSTSVEGDSIQCNEYDEQLKRITNYLN